MGNANEVDLLINNVPARALLDTGATVSVISESFLKEYLSACPLEPLGTLLDIECAGGESLPYIGFVETSLKAVGAACDNIEINSCLFLVVPDTRYNSRVPVLLGTNILSQLLKECQNFNGSRFLQKAALHTPWYLAFRSMVLSERELDKNHGRLGFVKSSETSDVVIPANSSVIIKGQINKGITYARVCALMESTSESTLSPNLDIMPTIITYDNVGDEHVEVHVSNVTTQTLKVPPRATLCELQPVTLQNLPTGASLDKDSLLGQVDIDNERLTKEEVVKGLDVILKFSDIFSKGDEDLGHSTLVQHEINLYDSTPFKQRHRRIPPSMYDPVRSHIQELLAAGVIRRSHSPWASNVVLAKKKDGKLRMCIDYRDLNSRTVKDSYSLPRVEELFDCLGGMSYFSVLDMKSGYHQVEILESHKQRTAFTVGPLGFYEYNRMPFGLSNAPATYQRLMEKCLEGLHLNNCLIYLDDVIIFSKTYEEHLEHLESVFHRLQECGLKLSPKKCKFFKRKVRYVGYIVSESGIEADPEKVDKIQNWPTPTTPEKVRQFLGFAGYYRKFVKDFSKIARPLSELMPKSASKKSAAKQRAEGVAWKWGSAQEEAFSELKRRLCSPPILAYPDFTKPFELHTDASTMGLGSVLYQEQGGQLWVIAYASRGLNRSERNYSAHKLEYLCLKWSITEKFHDYLYGHDFVVLTDNNPLTYVLTTARLDATGHRWLASLANYNFTIKYRSGSSNIDADILSRLHSADIQEISEESVKAICNKVSVSNFVESLCLSSNVLDAVDLKCSSDRPEITANKLRQAQLKDNSIATVIGYLEKQVKPTRSRHSGDTGVQALLKSYDQFRLVRGVLYRVIIVDGSEHLQLVLPCQSHSSVLQALHDDIGHPGRDRTLSLVRERFYWPGMTNDVENHVRSCDRCLKRKSQTNIRAPLVSISTTQTLELVCLDFLTLEPSKGGQQYVLVVTDHFTRYAQAYPCKNTTAKTTAELFFNNFVVHYGLPSRIHSDKGANFVGRLMTELCQLLNISK